MLTQREIGKLYGLGAGAVSSIKQGVSWSHITNNIIPKPEKHAVQTHRHLGVKHNQTTHLTEAQVIEIFKLAHSDTLVQTEIGKLYGISSGAVSYIKTGSRWSHLTKSINTHSCQAN
ncbi:MAG: hypothetical protein M0R51_11790 [Clostridia bacterium]|jgi:hypothetical protein|nr:hypothetical protein [Clostridia bacterium]